MPFCSRPLRLCFRASLCLHFNWKLKLQILCSCFCHHCYLTDFPSPRFTYDTRTASAYSFSICVPVPRCHLWCVLCLTAPSQEQQTDGTETGLGALNIFLCRVQQGLDSQLAQPGKINWVRTYFTHHLLGTSPKVCVTGGKTGKFRPSVRALSSLNLNMPEPRLWSFLRVVG